MKASTGHSSSGAWPQALFLQGPADKFVSDITKIGPPICPLFLPEPGVSYILPLEERPPCIVGLSPSKVLQQLHQVPTLRMQHSLAPLRQGLGSPLWPWVLINGSQLEKQELPPLSSSVAGWPSGCQWCLNAADLRAILAHPQIPEQLTDPLLASVSDLPYYPKGFVGNERVI
jgi:hypothetical protein